MGAGVTRILFMGALIVLLVAGLVVFVAGWGLRILQKLLWPPTLGLCS